MSILNITVNSTCRDQPRTPTRTVSWQQALKDAVRDPVELCRLVDLPPRYQAGAVRAADDFPVFAPRGYIARMRREILAIRCCGRCFRWKTN